MQMPNLKNIDLHSLFFFSKGGRYLKVGVALSDMKNGTRLFFQNDLRKVMNVITAQCRNFMTFLLLRFYVKSILGILKVQNLQGPPTHDGFFEFDILGT